MSLPRTCRHHVAARPIALSLALLLGMCGGFLGCKSSTPAASPDATQSAPAPAPAPDAVPVPTAANPPSAPASAAPSSTADAADARPVIVCFGDSLTAGYGTDPGQSYPDNLQRDLDHLGYHYRVENAGVSGNTTKDGADRLKDVLRLKPAVAIVAFGGNDGLRGLPIETTRDNLDRIVSTLKQAGAKVVLGGITLPPNYGPDYIHQFDETYQFVAKKYRVPLMTFILKDVYNVPGSMQRDGIHATAQGNKQVALNLLPLVKPLLKK
ncbi:MAG: arylesterase [Acidobacteriaceae bacterium]